MDTDIEETWAIPTVVHVPNIRIADVLNEELPRCRVPFVTSEPINAYEIPDGKEKAFPWLFCEGRAGYRAVGERNRNFPTSYFNARFLHKSGRCRKDMSYLFHASNFYERRLLMSSVRIHMKMLKSQSGPAEPVRVSDVLRFDHSYL